VANTSDPAGLSTRSERRRRGGRERWSGYRITRQSVVSYFFTAAALVAVILYTAVRINPIYLGSGSMMQQMVLRPTTVISVPQGDMAAVLGDSAEFVALTSEPGFVNDWRAFSADLVSTGRMDPARADSVGYFAVREAYRRGIPPALVFGVMLTENAQFVSRARSNVGAVGLMQIYPKVWLRPLSARLGPDLEDDETNLRYGAFILRDYIRPKGGDQPTIAEVRKGLLRYNGCVRGTNTRNCHRYPDKVAQYVERDAQKLCEGRDFYNCITRPFVRGLLGGGELD
jgi:hypothetical protein